MRKGTMVGRGEQGPATASAPSEAPISDHEVSSSRARLLDVVPIGWLDQLLVAALDLPTASGESAVVGALVNSVAAILPSYAVGACFIPEPDGTSVSEMARASLIIKRLPEGIVEHPAGADPTRVFPGLAYEHVVPLPASTTGSTLHLASDDHELDPDGSPAVNLIERAAMVLGRVLPNARAVSGTLAMAQRTTIALEQRMIHADKLATFGQVAAGVVHELNNPLTSIVAYSDYLIRRAIEQGGRDADDVERLRRISESANRMLRFTRELVSYARPSGGAVGPVVLHSVIDRAIAFCEHVLAAAGMQVERVYGPDVLTVRAVSEQLVQVFVNLITNACQAAPPAEGRLLVQTSCIASSDPAARNVVLIVVEDNGAGIAVEHVAHVFAPFFTTKGDKNGTGLGLSIVKSIVTGHGGEIRVESELGRGTRFVLEFPQRS
jgi:two-component system NtrC family sensor kinase